MTSFLSILAKSSGAIDQNLAVDKGNNGDVLISTNTGFSFVAANTLTPNLSPNLSQVLSAGNTAINNINLNGNITANTFIGNLTGTATTADNLIGGSGGSIPYQSAANTTALLVNGNSGQVLTSQGTSLAPIWSNITATTATITDTNTDAVFYPTFVSGTGSTQTLRADATTGAFSINPFNGNLNVADTFKITQTSVSLGKSAGLTGQGIDAVAIGRDAGNTNQAQQGIAIGFGAGYTTQATNAIAIGVNCGRTNQGANAIAIGLNAGNSGQTAGSICLNASGVSLNPAAAGFFVAPIRNVDVTNVVGYNTGTSEVTYFDETNLFGVGTPISFTPSLTDSGGNSLNVGNYNIRTGYYIKIGRMVFYEATISVQTATTSLNAANTLRFSLPFTSLNQTNLTQALTIGRMTGLAVILVQFGAVIAPNTDYMTFLYRSNQSATDTPLLCNAVAVGTVITVGGSYIANA